jgi:hypothetical protein
MLSALSRHLPTLPPPPSLVLARGDTFFVRRVELAPGEAIEPQVKLALEGMAPFPPEQLYFGHLAAADGSAALVFAAFRRRFTPEETEGWPEALLVAPEFAPLLAARPGAGGTAEDGAVLHVGEARVMALAWRAGRELPVAVLVRAGGAEAAQAVLNELWERAELPSGAALRRLEGPLGFTAAHDGALTATAGGEPVGPWPEEWARTGDVRDPDYLVGRRRSQVRDQWLWRGLLGAVALLVLAATLHLGAGVLGMLTRNREARITRQAPIVRQTETAQALANRIAELSEKRLMPFEMMAIINPARPDSVVFQRAITRGLLRLEVEAQAQNAEDVGQYENALRAQPGVASAAARDIRARDGVTSFVLEVDFRPEAFRNGGAL